MPKIKKKVPSNRTAVAVPLVLVKEFRKMCAIKDLNAAHEVRKMFKNWLIKYGVKQ